MSRCNAAGAHVRTERLRCETGFGHARTRILRGKEYATLSIAYENAFLFPNDMTATVDSIFAAVELGDSDALRLAADFLRPGFSVLAAHGIPLEHRRPTANRKERRLQFETEWSEWVKPKSADGRDLCPVIADVSPLNCQWQARLVNSNFEFNSWRPRQINIRAAVEIRVQTLAPDGDWVPAELKASGREELSKSIERALLRTYYDYLKVRGIQVDAPAFRRFR